MRFTPLSGGSVLLPLAASVLTGVLGLETVRQVNEGAALKDDARVGWLDGSA